jgi:hypothetical protein
MRAVESPRAIFGQIKREWQELMHQEKVAAGRFEWISERFQKYPTKENMDELMKRAREYSIRRMNLKRFETEE